MNFSCCYSPFVKTCWSFAADCHAIGTADWWLRRSRVVLVVCGHGQLACWNVWAAKKRRTFRFSSFPSPIAPPPLLQHIKAAFCNRHNNLPRPQPSSNAAVVVSVCIATGTPPLLQIERCMGDMGDIDTATLQHCSTVFLCRRGLSFGRVRLGCDRESTSRDLHDEKTVDLYSKVYFVCR